MANHARVKHKDLSFWIIFTSSGVDTSAMFVKFSTAKMNFSTAKMNVKTVTWEENCQILR